MLRVCPPGTGPTEGTDPEALPQSGQLGRGRTSEQRDGEPGLGGQAELALAETPPAAGRRGWGGGGPCRGSPQRPSERAGALPGVRTAGPRAVSPSATSRTRRPTRVCDPTRLCSPRVRTAWGPRLSSRHCPWPVPRADSCPRAGGRGRCWREGGGGGWGVRRQGEGWRMGGGEWVGGTEAVLPGTTEQALSVLLSLLPRQGPGPPHRGGRAADPVGTGCGLREGDSEARLPGSARPETVGSAPAALSR